MSGGWKIALTLLLILAVAYVFISPVLDLEPSANRAQRAAAMLLASIIAMGMLFWGMLNPLFVLDVYSAVVVPRGRPDSLRLHCISLI